MNGQPGRVVVIGGGITGLTAAYQLQTEAERRGQPLEVTLLEREDRLGGKLLTVREEGLIVEAGPDSFLASKPEAIALCEELGLEDRLVGTVESQRRTWVWSHGRLHRLPEGLTSLVPARFGPLLRSALLSPRGKARMLLDLVLPARHSDDDESLAGFIRRRLGDEAFERLLEPLTRGIYGGDAEDLSLEATFPQLRRLEREHGSLLRGVRRAPAAPSSRRWTGFVTLRGGVGELVEALRDRLRTQLRTGTEVLSIEAVAASRAPGRYRVRCADGDYEADALIVSTPAFVTAALLEPLDAGLAALHREVRHASSVTVSLAFDRRDLPSPPFGYGFVVPGSESRSLLACTWTSNKFPDRSVADRFLLRCFLGDGGGIRMVDQEEDMLIDVARRELASLAGLRAKPSFGRVFRWDRGMPQYRLGHGDRLREIDRRLALHPGLFLAGASYRGVGIPDCIRSGRAAANAALEHLSRPDYSQPSSPPALWPC